MEGSILQERQTAGEFGIWEKHSVTRNPEVLSKQDSLDGCYGEIDLAALSKVTQSRKSLKREGTVKCPGQSEVQVLE